MGTFFARPNFPWKLGRIWIWIRTSCYQYRCLPVIVKLKRGIFFGFNLVTWRMIEYKSGAGQKKPVGPQLLQSLQTLSNLRMAGSMMSGLLVAPMMKTFFLLPMPSISVSRAERIRSDCDTCPLSMSLLYQNNLRVGSGIRIPIFCSIQISALF